MKTPPIDAGMFPVLVSVYLHAFFVICTVVAVGLTFGWLPAFGAGAVITAIWNRVARSDVAEARHQVAMKAAPKRFHAPDEA